MEINHKIFNGRIEDAYEIIEYDGFTQKREIKVKIYVFELKNTLIVNVYDDLTKLFFRYYLPEDIVGLISSHRNEIIELSLIQSEEKSQKYELKSNFLLDFDSLEKNVNYLVFNPRSLTRKIVA